MNNNQYLNEEKYQQTNAKVKKSGKALLIIGIIILILGFILTIIGFLSLANIDFNDTNSGFGSMGLFAIGGFMMVAGGTLIGFGKMSMFVSHRREILAYSAQQLMPVEQEGIEKMTPTMAKAAGEIAKGIKQGLNDDGKK